jgi:poly(A) polymerase
MSVDLPQPKIIPRDQHPIVRESIDREALKVLYRLRDAGFSAYLVGGGVRDLFLGKTPKDFDISTDAHPGQLRKLFRNSRVIGRRFRLVQVFFHGNKIVEVSTLRCQSEFDIDGPDEVLAANNTFGTVAEDSLRRDLTINALFYEIENQTVIDHVGGVDDLLNGLVRMVGDPVRRIRRDPVRMMRAIRHAARNDFKIEAETWRAIKANPGSLLMCPDSRLRDELLKDLKDGASARWVSLALDCGIFHTFFPFYSKEITEESRKSLVSCLAVADRLQLAGGRLPEAFLFGLLLLPWALQEFDLLNTPAKGGGLNRKVRDKVDQNLKHLNIKRSQKEAIATLLLNLPVFISNSVKENWPAWLSKKSYFKEGLSFFQVYQEATGGPVVKAVNLELPRSGKKMNKPSGRGRKRSKGSRTPAFAKRTKGGVFGLKKK